VTWRNQPFHPVAAVILISVALFLVTALGRSAAPENEQQPQVAAVVVLVMVHGPGNRSILVNPKQVTSLHASVPSQPNKYLADEVKCLVGLADGKFVSTIETCEEVKEILEQAK
jgi:hypothetical protein